MESLRHRIARRSGTGIDNDVPASTGLKKVMRLVRFWKKHGSISPRKSTSTSTTGSFKNVQSSGVARGCPMKDQTSAVRASAKIVTEKRLNENGVIHSIPTTDAPGDSTQLCTRNPSGSSSATSSPASAAITSSSAPS